jgi:hypothetical protein
MSMIVLEGRYGSMMCTGASLRRFCARSVHLFVGNFFFFGGGGGGGAAGLDNAHATLGFNFMFVLLSGRLNWKTKNPAVLRG